MKKSIKKTVSSLLVMAMLLSLFSAGGIAFAAAKMELKDNVFTIEAENVTINENYTKTDDAEMSGKKGLLTEGDFPDQPKVTEKGDIEFSFVADKPGTFYFWANIKPTTVNKSIYLSMGGGEYKHTKLNGIANTLSWVKLGQVDADKAGAEILVKIQTATGYFRLDQFLITSNGAYVPAGASAPAPSPTAAVTAKPTTPTVPGKDLLVETKDGMAKFEAEAVKVISDYTPISDPELSGGKGLNAPGDHGLSPAATDPAQIEFSFKADAPGNYNIWVRTKPTTPNKSMSVSINQGEYKAAPLGGTAGNYHWANIGKISGVKAGDTVNARIRTRTGFFDIDNFLLTNKSAQQPEGKEGTLKVADNKLADNLYPKPTITPPAGHPRLYFQKADIPKILENAKKPQNTKAWELHLANLPVEEDGMLPAPKPGTGNTDNKVLGIIESWAFDYALNGNEANAKKAIAAIINYMDTLVLIDHFNDGYTRNAGHAIFTLAEVYDWCYPVLTAEDKAKMIDISIVTIQEGIEVGWPPTKQGSVTSHGSEAQILRDLNSFAIAVYDERPDIYNAVVGRFFADYVPSREYTYQSHMFNQGSGYGSYRGQWDYNATWIFHRLGLPNVFGKDQQYTPYWFIYARRPDGQILREGDASTNGAATGAYNNGLARVMMLAGNYFEDPYLKKEAARENFNFGTFSYGHGAMSPVEFLIFNNPDLEGRPIGELPLTKYFPAPMGHMIARTGWSDGIGSPDVVAQLKIDEVWFANHDHLDAGHFQLYYKGLLTGDTGRYGTYGTAHDYVYNKNTIAHNTLLVLDPSENMQYGKFNVNAGGQKPVNGGSEVGHISTFLKPEDPHHIGKVEGREFGPDPIKPEYTYLKGDLTKAYTEKIKDYDRSFMFLNLNDKDHPAALLVFDRVISSNKSFKKTWLLHGIQEPQINGNQTIFKRDADGYNGKLTVDTLLPKADNTTIKKVGGPEEVFWVVDKNYLPDNLTAKDIAVSPKAGTSQESDGWRIELSPKAEAETDYFFNVLQVGDANPDMPPLPITQIDTDKLAGAQIADRVVIFSKQNGRTKDAVEFSVTGDKAYKISVADVEAGTWKITRDGEDVGSTVATQDGGLLLFEGTAGSYKLTYENSSTAGRAHVTPVKESLEGIEIRIDKKYLYTDVPPTVKNDRTLVPMRAIFEALGAQIQWDDATSTVTGTKDSATIKLTIDSNTAYVNGKETTLDVAPTLIGGRTMVPIRFVSESLNAVVDWDAYAQCVYITSPKKSANANGIYPPLMKIPNALTVYAIEQSGSDGEGNDIFQSLDGNLATRWAVEGIEKYAYGIYDLGSVKTLDSLYLAYYNGDKRVYTFSIEVSEDGVNYTRVLDSKTTSGKTNELENYPLNGVKARYVKFLGGGNTANMWNSVTEIAFTEKK